MLTRTAQPESAGWAAATSGPDRDFAREMATRLVERRFENYTSQRSFQIASEQQAGLVAEKSRTARCPYDSGLQPAA